CCSRRTRAGAGFPSRGALPFRAGILRGASSVEALPVPSLQTGKVAQGLRHLPPAQDATSAQYRLRKAVSRSGRCLPAALCIRRLLPTRSALLPLASLVSPLLPPSGGACLLCPNLSSHRSNAAQRFLCCFAAAQLHAKFLLNAHHEFQCVD